MSNATLAVLAKMYVWRGLPSLRDYSDGLMCVIATSKSDAINLACDAYCGGTHETSAQIEKASAFRIELGVLECDEVESGAVYIRGGS